MTGESKTRTFHYSEFHPRWHRHHVSVYWWLWQRHYLKFILREISSVFVAGFVVMTLFQLAALKGGPQDYADFESSLASPIVIGLNIIAFLFLMFHAITWFNLAPSAMPVRMGGKRVSAFLVAAPSYVLWVAISVFVSWLILQ